MAMRGTLAGLLDRVVDVRRGEGGTVARVFLALFSLIAAHTILETARDALFLRKLPANRLAFVYVGLAVLTVMVTPVVTAMTRRFGRRNALVLGLVVSAYGTSVFHFLPRTSASIYALYIWSGILGATVTVQFWMLAGALFTVAQGKRLFGPVAAGGVLGAVFGATLAAAALELVAVHNLLLVAAGIHLATALLLTTVPGDAPPPDSMPVATDNSAKESATKPPSLLRDPYMLRIAALMVLSTAAVLVVDYLFKGVAAKMVPGPRLGAFFARYYAVVNSAAFITQVVVTGRLLRRFGVVAALSVLPLALLAGGFGAVALGGSLGLMMLVKGADGSMRHSLHRVSTELLWMPLGASLRDRGKALIDTVLSRATSAVTAFALLLLSALGLSSPRLLAAIVVVLCVGWLGVAVGLRAPYLDLLRRALSKGTIEAGSEELDIDAAEAAIEALSSTDPQRVVASMELLHEKGRGRLIPALILYHDAELVLTRALELLPSERRDDWVPLAVRLLAPQQPEPVRVSAVRALARRGLFDRLWPLIEDASPAVRAHVVFALARDDVERDLLNDPAIRELVAPTARSEAKVALLDAIRDHADQRWADVVLSLAESDDGAVVEHAMLAMATFHDARFTDRLIRRLHVRRGRGALIEALVQLGDPALDALVAVVDDRQADMGVRLHAPRAIAAFGSQRSADALQELLFSAHGGNIRYKLIRALGSLLRHERLRVNRIRIFAEVRKNLLEHLRLLALLVALGNGPEIPEGARESRAIIVGLLDDKLRQALERAFRLLHIAHREEDIRSVYEALGSKDRRVRANAQEFLDNLTLPTSREGRSELADCRELLRVLADDLSPAERLSRAARFVVNPPRTDEDALRLLRRDEDGSMATITSQHWMELRSGAA